jgi:hypothetical protein
LFALLAEIPSAVTVFFLEASAVTVAI